MINNRERLLSSPRPLFGLVLVIIGVLGGAEWLYRTGPSHLPPPLLRRMAPLLVAYGQRREWFNDRWWWLLLLFLVAIILLIILARSAVIFWHNVVIAKLAGTDLNTIHHGFPKLRFNLVKELSRTPAGKYFVGTGPRRQPIYLTEWDLDTHGHIMGHPGSGKTRSVLEPLMLQDLRRSKGLLFMDAKGSSENVRMIKTLSAITGRAKDLKVFALAFPAWSHTYNPVHLGPTGDPLATAERVFSVFPLEQEYYRGQSKQLFYNLVRLLAATGNAFNLRDLRIAIANDEALRYCMDLSDDTTAEFEINNQLKQLGHRRLETFTGLYNALADYDHPLLNAYDPDIVIEDIMNERGVVYFNLPANRYALLAPAIGKIVLQHIQAVGALRQIDRDRYDQTPFAVNIDELNRFAFKELVPSLAMLRDAHVQFRLSHQSLGDLEQVSPEFARQVKDNTGWKMFLFENDPDQLEKVSRSYGTRTVFKKTVRFNLGPFFTFLNTGDVSNREVEEFIIHPNALKSLAPQGQGYLLLPDRMSGVSFEILPPLDVPDYQLPKHLPGKGLDLHARFVESKKNAPKVAKPLLKPPMLPHSPVAERKNRSHEEDIAPFLTHETVDY